MRRDTIMSQITVDVKGGMLAKLKRYPLAKLQEICDLNVLDVSDCTTCKEIVTVLSVLGF